ncbi:hypothetical protein BBJ28_00026317, partial [Nothophytophthora sp. Chile5]
RLAGQSSERPAPPVSDPSRNPSRAPCAALFAGFMHNARTYHDLSRYTSESSIASRTNFVLTVTQNGATCRSANSVVHPKLSFNIKPKSTPHYRNCLPVLQHAQLAGSNTFNFQICNGGTNCNGVFENCIQLQETADVFMYNPFTVTRSLECNNLAGGVPVTYKDDYGARQCFCDCPAGFEMKENDYGNQVCEQVVEEPIVCVWADVNGFTYSVSSEEDVCSFHCCVDAGNAAVKLTVANLETANGLIVQYLDFADKATIDATSTL